VKKLESLNNKLNGKFILHLHRSVNDMGGSKRDNSEKVLNRARRGSKNNIASSVIESRIENTNGSE